MTASMIVTLYGLGAAALALWWMARFPQVGPHRAATALLAMVGAGAGLSISQALFVPVVSSGQYGAVAAMLGVFLPTLTAAFWAAACVLRAVASMLRS